MPFDPTDPTDAQERASSEAIQSIHTKSIRLFAEQKAQIEELHRRQIELVDKVIEQHGKLLTAITEESKNKLTEFQRALASIAQQFGGAIAEAASRGLQNMVSTMGADFQPGFGKAGEAIGSSLMAGIVSAVAVAAGVGAPFAAMLGAAVAPVGGAIAGGAQMALEGEEMMGARTAPMLTAGRVGGLGAADFTELGIKYNKTLRDINWNTTASREEIAKHIDALSKQGIALEKGGKDFTAYAFAADFVFNLNKSTVEALQTKLVHDFGESAAGAARNVREAALTMGFFQVEVDKTHPALARSFKSMQQVMDAMSQMSAGASTTGASIEGMNESALLLLRTLGESGHFRSEQLRGLGGKILTGLAPQKTEDLETEARVSGFQLRSLGYQEGFKGVPGGREHAEQIIQFGMSAPYNLSRKEAEMNYNSLRSMHLARSGRGETVSDTMMMLRTAHQIANDPNQGIGRAAAFLGGMGLGNSPQTVLALKEQGFDKFLDKYSDPHKMKQMFHDMRSGRSDDPELQDWITKNPEIRKTMLESLKVAKEGKSTQDKLAKHVEEIAEWAGKYWGNWKQTTREVFHLDPSAGFMPVAKKQISDAVGDLRRSWENPIGATKEHIQAGAMDLQEANIRAGHPATEGVQHGVVPGVTPAETLKLIGIKRMKHVMHHTHDAGVKVALAAAQHRGQGPSHK